MLYDIEKDPIQDCPINDPGVEKEMIRLLIKLMKENDALAEQFERLELNSADG